MKLKLDEGAKVNKTRASQLPHVDSSPKDLTCKPTSYMLWQITLPRFECTVPQIHIQLKRYVSYLNDTHITKFLSTTQGELEHRTSKVRFARTSRKAYASQLASIERRQACIRRIRMRRDALNLADPVPNQPEEHHIIGRSQNFPEELTRFVQSNIGDPATSVSRDPYN